MLFALLGRVKEFLAQNLGARCFAMLKRLVKMSRLQKMNALAGLFGVSRRRRRIAQRTIEGDSSGATCHLRIVGVVNNGGCTTERPLGLEYAPEKWMGAPAFRY